MNNKIKATALLVASLLGLPVVVNAADGTISFTGTIVAQGCSITTADQTIYMGNIAASTLNGRAGNTTSGKAFNIVGTNCPPSLSAIVFSGPKTADTSSGLFALSDAMPAGDVALGIFASDGTSRVLNGATTPLTIAGGGTDLNQSYFAKYVSTGTTVTPGLANATVTYTLEY